MLDGLEIFFDLIMFICCLIMFLEQDNLARSRYTVSQCVTNDELFATPFAQDGVHQTPGHFNY